MLRYKVVGFIYTYTCPLACAHCIVESGPKAKGKMSLDVARSYLKTISRYTDTLSITGGEPLLYYNEIISLIQSAVEIGLRTTLVTGGGWVRSEAIAERRIRGLKEAGLGALCISWDQYHEEFSPGNTVLLLAGLAKSVGLNVVSRGVIAANADPSAIEKKLVQISVKYQQTPTMRIGRALNLPETHFRYAAGVEKGGCEIVTTPAIDPFGKVYACCGPSRFAGPNSPLILGNTNEEALEDILSRASNDPLYEAIASIGPRGLYHLIQDHPSLSSILGRRDRYTGVCELCLDMCNVPEVVRLVRERLKEADARALVVACRMKQNLYRERLVNGRCSSGNRSLAAGAEQGDIHVS